MSNITRKQLEDQVRLNLNWSEKQIVRSRIIDLNRALKKNKGSPSQSVIIASELSGTADKKPLSGNFYRNEFSDFEPETDKKGSTNSIVQKQIPEETNSCVSNNSSSEETGIHGQALGNECKTHTTQKNPVFSPICSEVYEEDVLKARKLCERLDQYLKKFQINPGSFSEEVDTFSRSLRKTYFSTCRSRLEHLRSSIQEKITQVTTEIEFVRSGYEELQAVLEICGSFGEPISTSEKFLSLSQRLKKKTEDYFTCVREIDICIGKLV